jgi:hypothetical protein
MNIFFKMLGGGVPFSNFTFVGTSSDFDLGLFLLQANETGKYYVDCAEAATAHNGQDDVAAKKLWDISEKLVGLKLESEESS